MCFTPFEHIAANFSGHPLDCHHPGPEHDLNKKGADCFLPLFYFLSISANLFAFSKSSGYRVLSVEGQCAEKENANRFASKRRYR